MSGVDHNDQLCQYYHVQTKGRKYYKYMFGCFGLTSAGGFQGCNVATL